jgi:hypothetical protein
MTLGHNRNLIGVRRNLRSATRRPCLSQTPYGAARAERPSRRGVRGSTQDCATSTLARFKRRRRLPLVGISWWARASENWRCRLPSTARCRAFHLPPIAPGSFACLRKRNSLRSKVRMISPGGRLFVFDFDRDRRDRAKPWLVAGEDTFARSRHAKTFPLLIEPL